MPGAALALDFRALHWVIPPSVRPFPQLAGWESLVDSFGQLDSARFRSVSKNEGASLGPARRTSQSVVHG